MTNQAFSLFVTPSEGGRKRVLTDKQISIGKSLAADKSRSVEDICETLKISPATYYRYIHPQV